MRNIRNSISNKQTISYNEGHGFKKEVEIQLMKYLGRLSPEVEMPARVKGISGGNSYNVDIHITIKGTGLFANRGDIWVECKWKDNSPVTESDIIKLVAEAQDAFIHVTEFGGSFYDALIMVSNQDFDINALNYANTLDVLCLRYSEGRLAEKNTPTNWVGDPAWIKQENYLQAFR